MMAAVATYKSMEIIRNYLKEFAPRLGAYIKQLFLNHEASESMKDLSLRAFRCLLKLIYACFLRPQTQY